MAKITEIPRECPQCGGPVWDNTKREKKNPKAPDAACKDKDHCRWAGWLPEGPKDVKTPSRGPQQYPWGPLLKLSVQYVQKEIAPLFQNPTNELIKEMAVSLFITSSREGGDIFKKAAPAPAPVAPSPPPMRPASEYDDSEDGLPFSHGREARPRQTASSTHSYHEDRYLDELIDIHSGNYDYDP